MEKSPNPELLIKEMLEKCRLEEKKRRAREEIKTNESLIRGVLKIFGAELLQRNGYTYEIEYKNKKIEIVDQSDSLDITVIDSKYSHLLNDIKVLECYADYSYLLKDIEDIESIGNNGNINTEPEYIVDLEQCECIKVEEFEEVAKMVGYRHLIIIDKDIKSQLFKLFEEIQK